MAERVGFEPTIRFPVYTLSKRAPRTWQHAQLYFLNGILHEMGVRLNMFCKQFESSLRSVFDHNPDRNV